MPSALVIPDEYGYVLLTLAASNIVNIYHMTLTSSRRRAAKVPYPNAYATAEEAEKSVEKLTFNAAQRGHANFTETYPSFLASLAIAGLKYPVAASYLGAAWIVGRTMYAWGYARPGLEHGKNGRGRLVGAWSSAPLLGLIGLAGYTGWSLIA